jgi:uncharacterized Zn-finger protein
MSSTKAQRAEKLANAVHVNAKDLHGHGVVFCPNPKMTLWSAHPKVYLDVAKTGEVSCPYCGTHYVLDGAVAAGH